MLKDFSTAIFDLDGTLIDSISVWEDIDIRWLRSRGINADDSILSRYKLMSFDDAATFSINELGVSATSDELKAEWTQMIYSAYANEIGLKPFAYECLSKYKNEGKKIILATSCEKTCCEAVLAHNKITHFFDDILYTADLGKSKEYPDIYLACAGAANTAPAECTVFEDIYLALPSAHSAGMQFVGVYDEKSSIGWDKMKQEAELCVKSLEELL